MDRLCSYCGKREAEEGVFCPKCRDNRPDSLTNKQYLDVLSKIRHRIYIGINMNLDNSDALGDKHNYCDWGTCTNSSEVWSKPEYHIWPMQFKERGRIAPIDEPSKCPLDSREEFTPYGCFYKCLAFRPPKGFRLTKEHALRLYDGEIRKLRGLR